MEVVCFNLKAKKKTLSKIIMDRFCKHELICFSLPSYKNEIMWFSLIYQLLIVLLLIARCVRFRDMRNDEHRVFKKPVG